MIDILNFLQIIGAAGGGGSSSSSDGDGGAAGSCCGWICNYLSDLLTLLQKI